MAKLILLNGPPRCGKDTAAKFLNFRVSEGDTYHLKFAEPLHSAALASIPRELSNYYANDNKNEVIPWIGVSYRQLCINLSEEHFKPLYGQDVFGRIASTDIGLVRTNRENKGQDDNITFVVSDSGFAYEATPSIELIGSENTTLVRISRDGTSFDNDSRSYIDLSNLGVKTFDVVNTDLDDFKNQILAIYYSSISGHKISLG